MLKRTNTPIFTSDDIKDVPKKPLSRCIITADEIVNECLESIVTSIFRLAQHDMKVAIEKLQALDMDEVRKVYGKKYIGEKLTKKENGVNMAFAAHYRQLRELEMFFKSEWAIDLGIRNGEAIIRQVDRMCGYQNSEERRRALYVPNLLIEKEFDEREAIFTADDLYNSVPDFDGNGVTMIEDEWEGEDI